MTLGQLFGGSYGPTGVQYYDSYPTGSSDGLFADRDGGSSGYGYGPTKSKSKSKAAEKKQLAMSALTLLAFLFFLNILQNCLKEQVDMKTDTSSAAPALLVLSNVVTQPSRQRTEENLEDNVLSRGSRRLLQYETTTELTSTTQSPTTEIELRTTTNPTTEATEEERTTKFTKLYTTTESTRTSKFIQNYEPNREWRNDLSQLTEDEIKEQRIKTQILSLLQKKELQKTQIKSVEFQNERKKQKNFADFKEFVDHEEVRSRNPYEEQQIENSIKEIQGTLKNNELYTAHDATIRPEVLDNVPVDPQLIDLGTQAYFQAQVGVLNTPRTRRSESTTEISPEYDEDSDVEEFKRNMQTLSPLPAPTTTESHHKLTTKPYAYKYHTQSTHQRYTNHKYEDEFQDKSDKKEHKFQSSLKKAMVPQSKKKERIRYKTHADSISITTERSWNGNRPYSRYYGPTPRPPPPPPSGYQYRPIRRVPGTYQEPSFNIMNYVWDMFSSFTRPITNLVPMQKIGQEENRLCYDLLICEAHRASKLLGPSAQKMADTLSEVLTWVTTPEARTDLQKAVNSARFNTCQEQIANCEIIQGKSTMTMLAQILENRHRGFT